MDNFDGPPGHCLKVESHGGPGRYLPAASSYHSHPSPDPANLSFGSLNDDDDFGFTKKKAVRDPLSHRIIEKRRRDRMNNCLADLSRLIPTYYLKKGRGRIEKTEIIEMAIKYMKHLQAHACNQMENCEVTTKQEWSGNQMEQFHLGYQECMSETMQFLVESEGFFSGDSLCVRLMNHLTKHCEKILNSEGYVMRQNGASSSSSSGYHANSSSTGSSSDGNEESAYRSEERTGTDEQDDKSGTALDGTAGMGSQLREILQQHSGPGGSGDRRCGGYSSGLSSNNSSSGDDSSRLYKFKSNMKHRFSADLEQSHQVRKKRRDSESSCGNYTDCEKDRVTPTGPMSLSRPAAHQETFAHESNKIIDGGRDSPLLDKNHGSPSPVPKTENQGERNTPLRQASEPGIAGTVPIFALNQNGSFYVPLTIDQSLVAPIMSGLSDVSPVLHPVSIYVNFCGPCPTVTPNNNVNQQNSNQGTPILSHHPPGGRHNFPNHIFSNVSNFESGGYNGRHQPRGSGERKRREAARPVTQYEEHRPIITNINENLEKREPGEVDMREFHDARETRDHHHPDHPQRDVPRDLPPRHDQIHEARDTREQEQVHEVREVRNLRNIRDLREVREMREMRDPAQTVREFIDASSAYPNNTAYSRTHPHWAAAYHIQPKN